jgi:hypothetical protein
MDKRAKAKELRRLAAEMRRSARVSAMALYGEKMKKAAAELEAVAQELEEEAVQH